LTGLSTAASFSGSGPKARGHNFTSRGRAYSRSSSHEIQRLTKITNARKKGLAK